MERIEKLKEFLQKQPDDSFLQHALALEYIKIADDATARNLFEGLLKKDPGYVGSYYHLGQLLERVGDREEALSVYEKGMKQAMAAKDNHALNELRAVYEELADE